MPYIATPAIHAAVGYSTGFVPLVPLVRSISFRARRPGDLAIDLAIEDDTILTPSGNNRHLTKHRLFRDGQWPREAGNTCFYIRVDVYGRLLGICRRRGRSNKIGSAIAGLVSDGVGPIAMYFLLGWGAGDVALGVDGALTVEDRCAFATAAR